MDLIAWRATKPTEIVWRSRLPRCDFAVSSRDNSISVQAVYQPAAVDAVFVRSCHARRCFAAVALMEEDLLYDKRGTVGFRVRFFMPLNIRSASKQDIDVLGLSLLANST